MKRHKNINPRSFAKLARNATGNHNPSVYPTRRKKRVTCLACLTARKYLSSSNASLNRWLRALASRSDVPWVPLLSQ
eukprot:scaffold229748_cov30-Tisochrysis_lutea.AAC.2